MLFHPAVISLVVGSIVVTLMLLYACVVGVRILRRWDLKSGGELQVALERRTYLVSTFMSHALGFQLLSLFLFVYTVDHLAVLFVGAMCAAGSLNADGWGYPTLLLKIVNFLLAGLWLIVNHTDNRGYDYPLIRVKYALLLFMAPVVAAETFSQAAYFRGLSPNVITSCCGTLFTSDSGGVTSGIAALPHRPIEAAFLSSVVLALLLGGRFHRTGKGLACFAVANGAVFVSSVLALMSFVSLYVYELPTHHCPFCILHGEYGYVGYPLYISILGGALSGFGMAVIAPFRNRASLAEVVPRLQKGLASMTLGFHLTNLAVVAAVVGFSNLVLH